MPGVRFEVDVEYPGPDRFAALAADWLDRAGRILAGGLRDRIDQGPALPAQALRSPVPCGPPGAAWGFFSTERMTATGAKRQSKIAYSANLPKMAALFDDTTIDARLALFTLDEDGMPGIEHLDAYAYRDADARQALRLFFTVPEESLADRDFQDTCRTLLHDLAAEHDPLYGDVTYDADLRGQTVLEAVVGPPWDSFKDTIGDARQQLRGYGWITMVPRELVPRIGGADGLRATGAFAEVAELPSGALWLRATDDYRDYDVQSATAVVHALAPVLRPGRPVDLGLDIPDVYADLDPAEIARRG